MMQNAKVVSTFRNLWIIIKIDSQLCVTVTKHISFNVKSPKRKQST